MSELTHLDSDGRARMVDVGGKSETARVAYATGSITMTLETLNAIEHSALSKGDAIAAARIAGIMAAKRTSELIPLCHPLALTDVGVDLEPVQSLPGIRATAWASTYGRTGVEMEALTAVTVALLTIYDMAKPLNRTMEISDLRINEKPGGQSDEWKQHEPR